MIDKIYIKIKRLQVLIIRFCHCIRELCFILKTQWFKTIATYLAHAAAVQVGFGWSKMACFIAPGVSLLCLLKLIRAASGWPYISLDLELAYPSQHSAGHSRQQAETCEASQGLCSDLLHCPLCSHIIGLKSYTATPMSRDRLCSRWKFLQNCTKFFTQESLCYR